MRGLRNWFWPEKWLLSLSDVTGYFHQRETLNLRHCLGSQFSSASHECQIDVLHPKFIAAVL